MPICYLENLENVLWILSWNCSGRTVFICIVVYFGHDATKKDSYQIACLITIVFDVSLGFRTIAVQVKCLYPVTFLPSQKLQER